MNKSNVYIGVGIILSGILLSAVSQADNVFDFCRLREEVEAKITLAKTLEMRKASKVKVLSYKEGAWTEMTANNTGKDEVRVQTMGEDGEMIEVTYEIVARQEGRGPDCRILSIGEKK